MSCTRRACQDLQEPRCLSYLPPSNCLRWNDGCNTCSVNDDGELENCTEMACFVQGEASCLEYKTGGIKPERPAEVTIPEFCTGWFDGCNMCSVENGKVGICTMRWCEKPTAARCTGYTPPAGCGTWFDGCNSCRVGSNGSLACTKKFCDEASKTQPRCDMYLKD